MPQKHVQPETGDARVDSVEISDDARSQLANMADTLRDEHLKSATAGETSDSQTGDSRLERVRQRIANGYYERPEIAREIADRLLDELDM